MAEQPDDRGEALVAILNNQADMAILRAEGWYRVPVGYAPKRWPPKLIAFYQTKTFGDEAFAVRYYGAVRDIQEVSRKQLFPDEPPNAKSHKRYYQVRLKSLRSLPRPIVSLRLRRIVFIPTTIEKLWSAEEINDLFDDSPLEDRLWTRLKALGAEAERQWRVQVGGRRRYLDFALFCRWGQVDIETDGDRSHTSKADVYLDKCRDNALQAIGWRVLRFTGAEVHERMESYCVPTIRRLVEGLGGFGASQPYPPIDTDQIVMCETPEDYSVD